MTNVQIVGGGNIAEAFKKADVPAIKLVQTFHEFGEEFGIQIWEMSEQDFEKFKVFANGVEDWDSEKYGWWRNGETNVDGNDIIAFTVNGHAMHGFKNEYEYHHSNEFLAECEEEGEEPYIPSYFDLFEHLEEYWGVGKETNVALFIKSLAKINEMTQAEFVKKYVKQLVNN